MADHLSSDDVTLPDPASPADEPDVFVFPATAAQRRFWLLDQLLPGGNPALHMSVGLRWRGPVGPALLKRALNAVVARHESLRTTFQSERGQLRQLIAPGLSLDLPVTAAPAEANPAELMREEAAQPFDLVRGPLLRARLVRCGEQEQLLLLTVHHIISDGWSNGVLVRDLCAFYTAALKGTEATLPDLPIQFADYAEWQETQLAEGNFAAQRDYWRTKLAGDLPGLDLPLDQPRRAGAAIAGEMRSCLLPRELATRAKRAAAQENASAFMLFLAVFQALLHRYTGQADFLVTTPSANRERPEFAALVGLFVNPLLLRADVSGEPTFRELLARVRRGALEAFSNQDVPFELLLDELQAARLQVNFHYDAGLQQPLSLPADASVALIAAVSSGTVYELSLSVLEEPHGLRVEIEYNPALFAADTVERMLGHFQTLLESAVSDPTHPVSSLALLTPAEQAREPARTAAALDLRALLVARVMAQPDAIVARHGRRELSCAELLAHLENSPGTVSSERAPSDLEQAAAWVAHWRARLNTPPPTVMARTNTLENSRAAVGAALRKTAELREGERVASCTFSELPASEELGAALLATVVLVYPTPELMADSAAALATWLEAENIAVAFLPAATWNRLTSAIAARKARRPAKLRLVIVTEGEPAEGGFGRVSPSPFDTLQVCTRAVLDAAGGTTVLNGRALSANAHRLRVLDRSGQLLPIGIPGELAIAGEEGDLQRTGELARLLPNEHFERLGPIATQRYARGFRIDPRRTERALGTLPGVRHALVRAAGDTPGSPLVAYTFGDPSFNEATLRQHLRALRQPDLAIPDAFIAVKSIPLRTDDGTLDLAALPPFRAGQLTGAPEPVRPYLGLQLQLIAIWEEVLGVRGIGIRDDFFDLGGNSLLAMRMLQRAEAACGKVILPAALFRHPTIEHLAGEMAREARDESPALLRVHDAGTRTPFFYLHGDLSGGGFYSLKLSRALGADQPFYVLPPQDVRTLTGAPSIEEMASAHYEAMRAVRPHGPYVIGGFCISGLVAYELAQQIQVAGEKVEMLLIIDAAPDRTLRALRRIAGTVGRVARWNSKTQVAHFGQWAMWHARLVLRLNARKQARTRSLPERLRGAMSSFGKRSRSSSPATPTAAPAADTLLEDERDSPSAFQWASASYRPKMYTGPVALLLSEDVLRRADNVSRAWQQLAPAVTVQPLRGSHLECITEHVEALAQKIDSCLQSATSVEQPSSKGAAS